MFQEIYDEINNYKIIKYFKERHLNIFFNRNALLEIILDFCVYESNSEEDIDM